MWESSRRCGGGWLWGETPFHHHRGFVFSSCVVPLLLFEINGSKLLDLIVIGKEIFYSQVKVSKPKMCLPFWLRCYNVYSAFAGEQCGLC